MFDKQWLNRVVKDIARQNDEVRECMFIKSFVTLIRVMFCLVMCVYCHMDKRKREREYQPAVYRVFVVHVCGVSIEEGQIR